MGFTYIGGAKGQADGTGTSLSTDSNLNVQAGDLLVAHIHWEDGSGGTLGVSDGGSNSFTLQPESSINNQPYKSTGYVLSASANAAATFTFTNSNTHPFRTIIVLQFRPDSGDTVSLDPSTSNPAPATGNGTAAQSGNITTVGTDTVVVGSCKYYAWQSFSAWQVGDVARDGYVNSGTTNYDASMWYRILTEGMSAGHAQITGTVSTYWICDVIGFKAVEGAPWTPQVNAPEKIINLATPRWRS